MRWPQLYLGLGFTSLATLILELALTRIFSVVFYYHFAFLAISIALFGLGAGGVFSYVVANGRGSLYSRLGALAFANGITVVGLLWFVISRPAGVPSLAGVFLASAAPFFLAGTVVSIAISEAIERVDRTYFFDLAGAATGCFLLIPFLNLFGAPNTLIAVGVLYSISAAIWFNLAGAGRSRAAAVLLSLLLVMLIVANYKLALLDVRVAKGQALPTERFVSWNSFSRVGVANNHGYWSIVIDADAATAIAPFDWDRLPAADRTKLMTEGPGFPYVMRPGAKTLIIGAGGGYDVARAFASGSRDISAVEINPIIAETVMRDKFLAESHGLYNRPEVRLFVEDGRSFVRHSREQYQVLQATLVDTWASTAAGAFALSENNLYTTTAFYDYLSHLTADGIIAFTRWGFDPPRESLRVVSLAREALQRLGENRPQDHVMVIRTDVKKIDAWGAQDTILISRKPFTSQDLDRARASLTSQHIQAMYLPGDAPVNPFGQLLLASDPRAFLAAYRYDVSPVDDDRPFFFYTVQPRDLLDFIRNARGDSADYKINRAVPLLFGLVGVSLAATAVILVLPRIVLRSRLPSKKGVWAFLCFFLCLGAGYILIQVALIQKLVLLLGHPTYALTVIVFSMLVASGAGSFFSRRIVSDQKPGPDVRLMRVLAVIFITVALLAFGIPSLAAAAAGWPMPAKMAVTALAVAPAAFLMGMPFPSGLRRLTQWHPLAVRWAWSLNAAASVLGSAGAIFLAIYLGLRATLLIGAALYLCALAVIALTRKSIAA